MRILRYAMPSPGVITLNESEQRIARHLGNARFQYGRNNGVENKRVGNQSDQETDLNGMGAELAFCKHFNIYPDLQIGVLSDDDCNLPNGLGVDVKTTKYPNGRLLVGLNKKAKPSGAYALMIGTFPTYRYAGIISAERLFKDENIGNTGHGNCYLIDQENLYIGKTIKEKEKLKC